MVATTYQTTHDCSEETIWDNYLTNDEKTSIYNAIKIDLDGKIIINEDKEEISDVSTTFLEKFLAGLPRSLGDNVRDKIRSQSANGDILYDNLSYRQLISYIQKVALKICQDDKIQRQLAKEKAQNKRDLGSFCEQFGLPSCSKQKKK
ncbi:hypothetical protein CR513_15998, partial [Mucuna pruriens]